MTSRKEQLRRVRLNLCVECGINPQLEKGAYLIYPTYCRSCAERLFKMKQLLNIKISEEDLKKLFKLNPNLWEHEGVLYFSKVKREGKK